MMTDASFNRDSRLISLRELCEWLSITERHARKLVERDAIPYRKIGHLLRFSVAEVEQWSIPPPRGPVCHAPPMNERCPTRQRRRQTSTVLPRSLID
jgi:excisionase family DNA binding protein